jgi:glycerol-3-phosphate dehydrogenase
MADSNYDVVVIGAGVSGCAIARELSRVEASVCVVEQEEDVCCGTSKANSAIVHAGFDAQTGSLMARLNVDGARRMPGLCEELGVDYRQIGSLVVCTSEEARPGLYELLARGLANGVDDLRVIERNELLELEPNVSDAAVAALWAPNAGIVNPFQLTIALAEVAATNGVEFRFNEKVQGFARQNGRWLVATNKGQLSARVVVNAAGVYADELHNLVASTEDQLEIIPRRGQYHVLDTAAAGYVRHTVFALPTALGKGVLVTPTTAGNVLVGPTAEDIEDKRGVDTTSQGVAEVREKSSITMKDVPFRHSIRTFSGLRAHQPGHDFVIGEVTGAPGFVDCAAIESPGLSSAPAIGRMVADIVRALLVYPGEKPYWNSKRMRIPDVEHLSFEEWSALIAKRPDYGRIVCRCRRVTEGQIVDAIHSPLRPSSLDAVKRRVEAGMGRCQGGFCSPKVMEIIAREVPEIAMEDVTKMGPGSELVIGHTRPQRGGEDE